MKRSIPALAAVGGLLLTGCGSDGPEVLPGVEAQVVGRYYDDRDIVTVYPLIIDPAKYYLDVWQCGHEDAKTVENELGCLAIRVKVSRDTYQSFPDGSLIVFQD